MRTHTHARTHARTQARTHACACTHVHAHTHTHTQDNYSNPCCACALGVNNVYMILLGKAKNCVQNYRNACKPTQPTCTCTYILYIIDTCTLHTYCTLHTCIFHGWSNCPPPPPPAPRKALLTFSCCFLAMCEQTVLTSGWISLPCFDHTSRALCR